MAKKGSLKLIPEKKVMKAMSEMFARNVPSWDEIINEINKFQTEINNLTTMDEP